MLLACRRLDLHTSKRSALPESLPTNKQKMLQVHLAVLVSALVLVAAAPAPGPGPVPAPAPSIPELHRREDGHVVSDSSDESNESRVEAARAHPHPRVWSSPESQSDSHSQSSESAEARQAHHPEQSTRRELPSEHEENAIPQTVDSDVNEEDIETAHKIQLRTSWERLYKHGVVPAKLPAHEKDNGYRYRHSIVHGYGEDIHA